MGFLLFSLFYVLELFCFIKFLPPNAPLQEADEITPTYFTHTVGAIRPAKRFRRKLYLAERKLI